MVRSDFFRTNVINFLGGGRITSFEEFSEVCSNYEIDEHQVKAENNELFLSPFDGPGKISIQLTGSNNQVVIGEKNFINHGLYISFTCIPYKPPTGVIIEIGEKNFFNGNVYITSPVCKGRSIRIGNHNLFANRILFMGRNDHGIFDATTHEQLNVDADLFLGDRNWICKDAEFYPKAKINNDCVIAAHTLVNKPFSDSNILVAGVPAKIKRRNIVWNVSCDVAKLEEKPYNPLYTMRPD